MFTEDQVKTYLENISPNPEFTRFEFLGAEKFVIHIKCDIDKNKPMDFYGGYVDKWIKSFSKFTATMWSARSSYTKMKTLLLQKTFDCQPVDYKSKDTAKTECRAQIEFKVKLINGNTDLNLYIMIDFDHSHNVYATPASSIVETMSDTDKLFFEYFDNGFNATTSKTYHELSLIEKHGPGSSQYLADEDVNPSIEHIKFLIDKMQSKEIKRSFSDILEAKKAFIKDSGGTLMYSEKPEIVVIVTPLMRKAILNQSLDCVLVDSSVVKIGLVVTYFYTSNKIGALPIACVLHTEATESNFREAFNILTVSINALINNFYPKIFIVNDMQQQKVALSRFFPKSKVLASHWSVCCEIWKWLCNEDLKIAHRGRHSLMFLFKSLIYASADSAHTHYSKLLMSNYFDSTTRLREYIDYLWRRSDEWIARDDYQLHPLTEVSIRLMKEFLLRKCRFFNVIMMIDVVSKLLENQLKTLINTYIDGMPKISNYTIFFHRSYLTRSNEHFMQIRFNEFMVQYQSSPNLYYHVKMDTTCCDCAIGKQGRLCDHLGIVLNKGAARIKIPLLTNIEVDLLMKFIGLSNDNIKCELLEESADVPDGSASVQENTVYLNKYQRDCAEDAVEIKPEIQTPTYEEATPAKFFVLKKIKKNKIRAINRAPDIVELLAAKKVNKHTIKRQLRPIEVYMRSVQRLNEEFHSLMSYLKNNPITSNIQAIHRITKEMRKIRPQLNVDSLTSDVITHKKKKPNN